MGGSSFHRQRISEPATRQGRVRREPHGIHARSDPCKIRRRPSAVHAHSQLPRDDPPSTLHGRPARSGPLRNTHRCSRVAWKISRRAVSRGRNSMVVLTTLLEKGWLLTALLLLTLPSIPASSRSPGPALCGPASQGRVGVWPSGPVTSSHARIAVASFERRGHSCLTPLVQRTKAKTRSRGVR